MRSAHVLAALALLAACSKRQPENPPASVGPPPEALKAAVLFARAVVADEAGRSKEAETLYGDSLRAGTGAGDRDLEFRTRFNLGTLLLRGHRPDEARTQLDAATRLRPDHAAAWYNLGLGHAAAGRDTDAVYPLMQAVTLDPGHAPARYNLGFVLWRGGRKDEAKMHLEIAASQDAALKTSVDRLLGRTPPPAAVPPAHGGATSPPGAPPAPSGLPAPR